MRSVLTLFLLVLLTGCASEEDIYAYGAKHDLRDMTIVDISRFWKPMCGKNAVKQIDIAYTDKNGTRQTMVLCDLGIWGVRQSVLDYVVN